MIEEWRPVIGVGGDYDSLYDVSNLGRVRRVRRIGPKRILTQKSFRHGYRYVNLWANGKQRNADVHRLVSLAFPIGGAGPMVCHIDGDPSNNRADNLRRGTAKDNADDRDRHGRTLRGENHPSSKLTRAAAIDIMSSTGPARLVGQEFGVSSSTVNGIRSGQSWKHLHANTEGGAA